MDDNEVKLTEKRYQQLLRIEQEFVRITDDLKYAVEEHVAHEGISAGLGKSYVAVLVEEICRLNRELAPGL